METLRRFIAQPSPCGYLPEQWWRLEYELIGRATPADYLARMLQGWRRFGDTLFRPRCLSCCACRSLRVLVDRFQPDRSQRRCRQANQNEVRLTIGAPSVTRAKLRLYDLYHAYQSNAKGWPLLVALAVAIGSVWSVAAGFSLRSGLRRLKPAATDGTASIGLGIRRSSTARRRRSSNLAWVRRSKCDCGPDDRHPCFAAHRR